MSFWDGFGKYCGIQGLLALIMVIGYLVTIFIGIELPESYPNLMSFVIGFYFAKNGVNIVSAIKGGK